MSNTQPKKIGRPRVDSDRVEVRFLRPLLSALDRWAADNGVHRAEAVRLLLSQVLKVEK